MTSKPNWNLQDLKEKVEAKFGSPQRDALELALKSITQRQEFAKYHFAELARKFKEATGTGDTTLNLVNKMADAAGSEPTGEFLQIQLAVAANAHATLQCVHTFADVLAHAIYFALGMNLRPEHKMSETGVRMETVQKRLGKVDGAEHIVSLLDELVNDEDFRYLGHVVNQSKHYAVVDAQIAADLTGAGKHEIFLKALKRGYVSYGPRRFGDFMKAEYDRQSRLIVHIGIAVNAWISNSVGEPK